MQRGRGPAESELSAGSWECEARNDPGTENKFVFQCQKKQPALIILAWQGQADFLIY